MGKDIDLSGIDPRAQWEREPTEEEAAFEAAEYEQYLKEGRLMENLESIFDRQGLEPFILRTEQGICVDFDSGINLTMECLDQIRLAFPDKAIKICGFIDETGFRIKIE